MGAVRQRTENPEHLRMAADRAFVETQRTLG